MADGGDVMCYHRTVQVFEWQVFDLRGKNYLAITLLLLKSSESLSYHIVNTESPSLLYNKFR